MITTVLFDLDGTLLPMDQEEFTHGYFKLLVKKLAPHGYSPEELIAAIWKGTGAMVKNDGKQSNETVFWKSFAQTFGEQALADQPLFEDFYANDFKTANVFCGYDPEAKNAVITAKEMGFRTALATNPIFPSYATEIRIGWTGLSKADFEFYTSYEDIGYSKPNTEYFAEVARRMGVPPEECLMVGNDVSEDMIAENIGMHTFLITNCMINKENRDISRYPHGTFADLIEYLRQIH